jgi:hypothetical protein
MKNLFWIVFLLLFCNIFAQENIPREVDVCIQQKNQLNFERLCTPEYIHYQRHEQIKSFFEYCLNHELSVKGELYVREKNRAILPVKVYNKNKLYVGKAYFYLIRNDDLWYIDGANFQDIGDDRSPLQKFNALFLEGKIRGFYHPRDLTPDADMDKQAQQFVKQLKKKGKTQNTKYVWDNEVVQQFVQKNQSKIVSLEYLQNHCDTTLNKCVAVFSYMEQEEKNYLSLYFEKQGKAFVPLYWDNRLPKLVRFLREDENLRP